MLEFLKGKKTYLLAVLFLAGVLVPVIFKITIPEEVFGILGALGLGAFRAAISKVSGNHGYKTYLAAFAVAIVSIASALGATLPLEIIYGICSVIGVVGVRDAVEHIK